MRIIEKYFNKWAKEYDSYLPRIPHYRKLIRKILNEIRKKKDLHILDVGIGTGLLGISIQKKTGCHLIGIDISEKMLAKAKKKAKELGADIILRKANVKKLKFRSSFFDYVVASFTLHHLPDKDKIKAIKEIFRVLKPNSKFILGEVVVDIEGNINNLKRLKHITERWGYAALNALKYTGYKNAIIELESMKAVYNREGEYLISTNSWARIFKNAGFKNIKKKKIDQKLGYWVITGIK